MAFDGYDLAIACIALPSIMKDMGVNATSAGFMVSSALFGMMIGAIFFGTVADRMGRRLTIAVCIGLFSIFTAAAGITADPITFSVTRFLAGLGIGGVMPNVVAQMTEYSPKRIRSTMVTLMFSGYAVGGMLAAVLSRPTRRSEDTHDTQGQTEADAGVRCVAKLRPRCCNRCLCARVGGAYGL